MSDLRDRIAAALRQEGGDPDDPQTARELADAVMGVIEPEIAAYDSSLSAVLQRAQRAEAALARPAFTEDTDG